VGSRSGYERSRGRGLAGVGVALLPRLAVAVSRRPDVILRPLDNTVIERITFIATRAGAYQSPLVTIFRAALRMAAATVAAPGLPLEMFEPERDTAQPAGRR
jgi:DNA-binding transcriptional LysR family regulator